MDHAVRDDHDHDAHAAQFRHDAAQHEAAEEELEAKKLQRVAQLPDDLIGPARRVVVERIVRLKVGALGHHKHRQPHRQEQQRVERQMLKVRVRGQVEIAKLEAKDQPHHERRHDEVAGHAARDPGQRQQEAVIRIQPRAERLVQPISRVNRALRGLALERLVHHDKAQDYQHDRRRQAGHKRRGARRNFADAVAAVVGVNARPRFREDDGLRMRSRSIMAARGSGLRGRCLQV